ncbi:MAG: hypothetical protein GX542_12460 [Rhodococcus sp.]|nr:hypothetical protein [Rhodococcus sp. (in: high G+C Gram-positive bacteria)]
MPDSLDQTARTASTAPDCLELRAASVKATSPYLRWEGPVPSVLLAESMLPEAAVRQDHWGLPEAAVRPEESVRPEELVRLVPSVPLERPGLPAVGPLLVRPVEDREEVSAPAVGSEVREAGWGRGVVCAGQADDPLVVALRVRGCEALRDDQQAEPSAR